MIRWLRGSMPHQQRHDVAGIDHEAIRERMQAAQYAYGLVDRKKIHRGMVDAIPGLQTLR